MSPEWMRSASTFVRSLQRLMLCEFIPKLLSEVLASMIISDA